MRWILAGIVFLSLSKPLLAAESPLVEAYLHSGQLAKGEQVLEAALASAPKDDHVRLSLAVLKLVRAVERLGQALHQYGCRSENSRVPFVRLPVPANANPSPIVYADFRRLLQGFHEDLASTEATLAAIADDGVALTLRLSQITLDLDSDGQATDKLVHILKTLMGREFELTGNPEFQVRFDRGDVAWLRAYCHLLMAMLDFQLALDLEQTFDITADEVFTNPKKPFKGNVNEKWRRLNPAWKSVTVKEPARLNHFRQHLLVVCEMNYETWKFIRAERDDVFEWLPSPKQTGVLGLPVTDVMIDTWLGMIEELEGLLNGKKVVPAVVLQAVGPEVEDGLSLRRLLEDPPEKFEWERIAEEGPAAKYLDQDAKDVDFLKIIRVGQVFQNSLSVGYAAWFN